jgi:ribosomal protein S18 acetylase RimI-like enzyme
MNIRQARTEDVITIARVHIDTWRTTFAGIVPQNYLDQFTYAESEEIWTEILQGKRGDRPFFVAETSEKQVVGFILGGANRLTDYPSYLGELIGIYIVQSHQGQGLGHSLTQTLVEAMVQRDCPSMLVWTLTRNPACRFYEALGAQLIGKDHAEVGGAVFETSVYGWTDTHLLQ